MSNPLTLWVAASFLAHTLGANAVCYALMRDAARESYWTRNLVWQSCGHIIRLAFFVGVPYLALIRGIVTPAQFALGAPDSSSALNVAAPLTLSALGVGALAIGLHARTLLSRYPLGVFPAAARRAQLSQPWGVSFVLLDALCLQAHWMFYRAGATAFFDGDTNAGIMGGLALVLIEWLLDPRWRRDVRRLGRVEDRVLVAALAVFSALFVLPVANFWLVLASHIVLWLVWLWWMQWLYKSVAAPNV